MPAIRDRVRHDVGDEDLDGNTQDDTHSGGDQNDTLMFDHFDNAATHLVNQPSD